MSDTQLRDVVTIGKKNVSMHGKFRLKCNRDPSKFFMTNIDASIPRGKTADQKDYFYNVNGPVSFLLIDKIITFYRPDESDIDAKNVAALIRNEDVRLEDMNEQEHEILVKQGLKKPNCLFSLVNLDKSELDNHNEDVEMIEIKYLITKKSDPLSKKKLMFIVSSLGLPTASQITDEKRYKVSLQTALMNHLQSNKQDREKFLYFYEKIAEAEIIYYINQFIERGYVVEFGGMYKIEDRPIGMSFNDIKEWFSTREDEYNAYKLEVDEYNSNFVTR